MFNKHKLSQLPKEILYQEIKQHAESLTANESNLIANTANISSLLFNMIDNVNWVGFYFLDPNEEELILGPFQGNPACTRIPVGKGICGLAAQQKEPLIVSNVYEFEGHITCDPNTQSECVIPFFFKNQSLAGVLDLNSRQLKHFDEEDVKGLSLIINLLRLG